MKKRVFDVLIALFGLILFSPIFIILCIAIKASASGPTFLKKKKSGKGFLPYTIFQFDAGKQWVSTADSSMGKGNHSNIGITIRHLAVKVNKLLQLYNVLVGEMSLVGPKPRNPAYVEKFKSEYETILQVAPGIVDLSSIVFHHDARPSEKSSAHENQYTRLMLPKKIKLAKAYVQDRSFVLDLKILFTTLTRLFLSTPWPLSGNSAEGKKQLRDAIFDSRSLIIFVTHLIAIFVCNYTAFLLRFNGEIPSASIQLFLKTIPYILVIRLGILYLLGLNHGLWRYTSLRDILNIGWAVLSSSVFIWGLGTAMSWIGYPRSIYVIDAFLLIVVLSLLRSSKRIYSILTQTGVGARRVLVIGAGNAGEMIIRDMKQDQRYGSHPVAFIDDDPKKRFKKIHNVPVIGNSLEMEMAVSKISPDEILIAIPSATPAEIKKIINRCKPLNLPIKTLPNLPAIFDGKVSVNDIRSLDIEDLIGRPEIHIQNPAVSEKIQGKRVLITGAGGSIGSELCRQVVAFHPEELILLERNENNLYQLERDLLESAPSVSIQAILADILDSEKTNQIFSEQTPDIVFHAAAYKHVPMMEKNPLESVRNNIIGTYQLMTASERYGVETFVLISTDKAVSPSSVMGATKRVAEMMGRFFDYKSQTRFVSVRFGNVLESSGSIVPLFREQIKNRKPVKVTHPEVTRYFISLQESVQLVLEASVLGKGGEVFVLDMGKPIKIIDLAKTMIMLSGLRPEEDIPIQLIGLRPGEKLHESLFEENEEVVQTRHEKISLARNGKINLELPAYIERFAAMDNQTRPEEIKSVLKELVPTYQWEEGTDLTDTLINISRPTNKQTIPQHPL